MQLGLITQTLNYYANKLSKKDKKKVEKCIELISCGMKSTLVRFCDGYYNYQGAAGGGNLNDPNTYTLAIGTCEVAFCTDLSVSYIFEMLEKQQCFKSTLFK
eukprot:5070492-Ditylum_brightwellii.AAC.1